jgi:hypothetical protein
MRKVDRVWEGSGEHVDRRSAGRREESDGWERLEPDRERDRMTSDPAVRRASPFLAAAIK